MVGRHGAEIAGLRQARLATSSSTFSRGPSESSRLPVPIYFGDRNTSPNFLKLFRTWILAHDAENTIVTNEPVRVVGKDWDELDNTHGREKANQYISVWTALLKGIERDKTLLDMITTTGSPSEAWYVLKKWYNELVQVLVYTYAKSFVFRTGKEQWSILEQSIVDLGIYHVLGGA